MIRWVRDNSTPEDCFKVLVSFLLVTLGSPLRDISTLVNFDNRIAISSLTRASLYSHRPSVEAMNEHREPSHPMSVEARRDSFPGSWRSEETPLGRLHAREWTINTDKEM